jgi:hypothetical protein
MICNDCLKGGEENKLGHYKRSANWHEKCENKGCVCQHKTGQGWFVPQGERPPLMQTQSP